MISATKKWIFLKLSSAILVPLMIWFLFNLVSFYDKSYEEVTLFFTKIKIVKIKDPKITARPVMFEVFSSKPYPKSQNKCLISHKV